MAARVLADEELERLRLRGFLLLTSPELRRSTVSCATGYWAASRRWEANLHAPWLGVGETECSVFEP